MKHILQILKWIEVNRRNLVESYSRYIRKHAYIIVDVPAVDFKSPQSSLI